MLNLPSSHNCVAGLVANPEVAYVPIEGAALVFFEPRTALPYITLFEESEGILELLGVRLGVVLEHLETAELAAIEQGEAQTVVYPEVTDGVEKSGKLVAGLELMGDFEPGE